ncbi:regulator of microtubule dynamics protein 1-like [Toxorhynchites rutilus septentrionalis]|uniref:regulator of microtubule dynamics protein 1-like n=1 Tax=Toxorhynchites rutilus septentrionalis TaxID=329112 RepID=UPI002479A44B|nr:regulator of microtubule dynamics protein 1-like [Toxorhynchites rutilus septentrionalis]
MSQLNEIIVIVDRLFDECKFEDTCALLKRHVEPPQYEIQWRLARAIYSVYKEHQQTDKKRADALIHEGYEVASKMMEIAPNAANSHRFYATFLLEQTTLEGPQQAIRITTKALDHIKTAKRLDPGDPFVWLMEGVLYGKLASLPWLEKKFIQMFNRELVQPTLEDALECLLKAEQLRPNFLVLNNFLIGKIYYDMKEYGKAKVYLGLVANLDPVRTADERNGKEMAVKMLKKLQ